MFLHKFEVYPPSPRHPATTPFCAACLAVGQHGRTKGKKVHPFGLSHNNNVHASMIMTGRARASATAAVIGATMYVVS
jgi:hypothetical protein